MQNNFNLGIKIRYLGTFGLQFSKTIVIFEINALQLVKIQGFVQNKKTLKFATKNLLFG